MHSNYGIPATTFPHDLGLRGPSSASFPSPQRIRNDADTSPDAAIILSIGWTNLRTSMTSRISRSSDPKDLFQLGARSFPRVATMWSINILVFYEYSGMQRTASDPFPAFLRVPVVHVVIYSDASPALATPNSRPMVFFGCTSAPWSVAIFVLLPIWPS